MKEAVKVKIESSIPSNKFPFKKEHKDNSEVQLVGETRNDGKRNKISEIECFDLLNHTLSMLGLSKVNVEGRCDCKLLAVRFYYFGRRRYDESDRNADDTASKWHMINYFQNRTWDS